MTDLRVDVDSADPSIFERVDPRTLRPHPRNYRVHPPDQIEHLRASIRRRGFYKNVVIARDDTILAGHGATEAAILEELTSIPARRLDLDPEEPEALSILAGDNELMRFAEIDDRGLTELLRDLNDSPVGLEGTGYDEMILANLVMVTRHASEIETFDAAAAWVGLPDYEPESPVRRIVFSFLTDDDRQAFLNRYEMREFLVPTRSPGTWSAWWPLKTETRHDGGLRHSQAPEDLEA